MDKIETPQQNTYVEKIGELNEKYKGASMFPMGSVQQISYSNLGKTLSIDVTGDVPTNFEVANIIIVHPDAEHDGWIGKGKIGFTLNGKGVDISKIPLPGETLEMVRRVYAQYTGKELREHVYQENDINTYANMGLYNSIVEAKNS